MGNEKVRSSYKIFEMASKGSELVELSNEREDWMEELLHELSEGVSDPRAAFRKDPGELRFTGEIRRKKDAIYDDHVVLRGELYARFRATCVQSGELIWDEIRVPLRAVFLSQEIIKKYYYEDEITIEVEGEAFELYGYEGQLVELPPVIKEQLFLNKNPYPSSLAKNDEYGPLR